MQKETSFGVWIPIAMLLLGGLYYGSKSWLDPQGFREAILYRLDKQSDWNPLVSTIRNLVVTSCWLWVMRLGSVLMIVMALVIAGLVIWTYLA